MRPLFATLLCLACSSDAVLYEGGGSSEYAPLPVVLEFGHRMDDGGEALLFQPLDAAFLGDTLAVLDRIPPWIRLYDSSGDFIEARVPRGDGPGELRAAYGLSSMSGGHLLVTHPRGVLVLSANGESITNLAVQGLWLRGAAEGCEEGVWGFASPIGESDGRGVVGRLNGSSAGFDEILKLGQRRLTASTRRDSPFLNGDHGGVLLFTEEVENPRIVRIDCEGMITEQVGVPQLGAPEVMFQTDEPGRFGISRATAPLPAGFADTKAGLLWVSLELESRPDGGADSVTVFRILEPPGSVSRRMLRVKGWFVLHDQNRAGHLLMSDSYAMIPRMVLVDAKRLLAQMDSDAGGG